jgi:hypothetical protein
MKTCKSFILLVAIISFEACKKESTQFSSINTATQNNIAETNCKSCPEIDPSNFVKEVTNPYFPLKPGTIYYYVNKIVEDKEISTEHDVVAVTSKTKIILGVSCTVVHDVIKAEGIVTEDTYDWYAQDKYGNVWYMGENTKEREDTGWSTEGSWEAGVDGACAGIIMWARPQNHIGKIYYQEFLKGEAEDQAQVINTNSRVKVPFGTFENCLDTKEFTRLERGVASHKFYAQGVGEIKEVQTRGGTEVDELISVTHQ